MVTILKIKQKSLSEIAYNKIKELILSNALKPGTKIKQEETAKLLCISKIPLRQALSMLESEGLVQSNHRKGFYVRYITKEELNEVIGIRTVLENISVFLIDGILNNEIKNKFLKFLKEFESAYNKKEIEKYYNIDRRFHHYLIEASNNRILLQISNMSNVQVLRYTDGLELDVKTSYKHHKEIIEHILNSRPKEASEVIKIHFICVKDSFTSKI